MAAMPEQVLIEYLFLDDAACGRCRDTGQVLQEVIGVIAPALELAGYAVTFRRIRIENEEMAVRYRLLSSPTIRVRGKDVFGQVEESSCGCCSSICGMDVDCRSYTFDGRSYDAPPAAMLARALLRSIFGGEEDRRGAETYALPENLRDFFAGKKRQLPCV